MELPLIVTQALIQTGSNKQIMSLLEIQHHFISNIGNGCDSLCKNQSIIIIIIWFVRLLALGPLLAYCASLG
jgi:hypothetical protein